MVHRQSRICLLVLVLVMIFILQSSKVAADDSAGILQYEENDFEVEVSFDKNADIPEGAYLKVAEIVKGTSEYEEYHKKTKETILSEEGNGIIFVRFLDISIMNENEEIEPNANVNVTVRYKEGIKKEKDNEIEVIHFPDNDSEELLEISEEIVKNDMLKEISFEQSSFSVIGMIIFDGNDSEVTEADSEVIRESDAIDVKKIWSDGNDNHMEDTVTVALYESESGLDNWKIKAEKILSNQNSWKVQFDNLDKTKFYKVRERKVTTSDIGKKVTYKANISISVVNKWTPLEDNIPKDGENVFMIFNDGKNKLLRKSSVYADMNLRNFAVTIEEGDYGKYLSDATSTRYLWQTNWNETNKAWTFYNANGDAYLTLIWNEESLRYEWVTSREIQEGSYITYEDGIMSSTLNGKKLFLGNITSSGPYKALEENDAKITKFEIYNYKSYHPATCQIVNERNETVEEMEIQTDMTTRKIIDYLGDGNDNPETEADNQYSKQILKDLYRLKMEVKTQIDATGLDLLMVIDVSSSMKGVEDAIDENGNKIKRSEALRQALNVFIPSFLSENERNRLSVVAFEDQSVILQEWTSDPVNILEIINYVDENGEMPLYNGSGTNYEAALSRAHEVLSMRGYSGNAQAMFFLSDGSPTTHISGNDELERGNITINLGEAKLGDAGITGTLPEGLKYEYTPGTQDAVVAANEAISSFKKHNSKIMIGTIAFNTKVTDSLKNLATDSKFVVKIENGTPNDLIDAMELITEYIPKNIVITDVLSENVELFEEKPDFLATVINDQSKEITVYDSNRGLTKEGKEILDNDQPICIEDNKISLRFAEEYEVQNNYIYTFSFLIKPSQNAFNQYAKNDGKYTETGDKDTDYEGNNTSSEKKGFLSNADGSEVSYLLNGALVKRKFAKPVIQVRDSRMIIKKTDLDGNVITKGTEFALYRKADTQDVDTIEIDGLEGKYIEEDKAMSNEYGEVTFEHLRTSAFNEGYPYYLIETKEPDGYVKCDEIFDIHLFENHVEIDENNAWIGVNEEGKVVVRNAEYVEPLDLPVTGGNGNLKIYLLGILLLTGGLYICLRKKDFQK